MASIGPSGSIGFRFAKKVGIEFDENSKKTNSFFPKATPKNRLQNAFRHVSWQAVHTMLRGKYRAKAMGNAHDQLPIQSIDALVDLHNNVVGREIGQQMLKKGWHVYDAGFENALFNEIKRRTRLKSWKQGKVIIDFADPEIKLLPLYRKGLDPDDPTRSSGGK